MFTKRIKNSKNTTKKEKRRKRTYNHDTEVRWHSPSLRKLGKKRKKPYAPAVNLTLLKNARFALWEKKDS